MPTFPHSIDVARSLDAELIGTEIPPFIMRRAQDTPVFEPKAPHITNQRFKETSQAESSFCFDDSRCANHGCSASTSQPKDHTTMAEVRTNSEDSLRI